MTLLRSLWVALNGVVCTVILSSLAIIAAMVGHRGGFYDWVARTWARWIIWSSAVHIEIDGLENLRGDRPQVIASNHQSWYDVFAIAATLPKRYRFIAKEE